MKNTSLNSAFFVALFTVSLFITQAANASNSSANINKGDVTAGGSLALGYSSLSKFHLVLRPSLEYFVADNFSVGGEVIGDFDALVSQAGIGPKATFYFWSQEKWAADVAIAAHLNRSNAEGKGDDGFSNYFDVVPSTSVLYFILPSVAVGPTLTVDVPVNRKDYNGETLITTSLAARLSVYF